MVEMVEMVDLTIAFNNYSLVRQMYILKWIRENYIIKSCTNIINWNKLMKIMISYLQREFGKSITPEIATKYI